MIGKRLETLADLTHASAVELAEQIARGEVSSQEVVEAHIAQIEQVNPRLNAVVVKRYGQARAEAKAADARRASGERLPPLHGVPVTIKECLAVEGTPSTFGLTGQTTALAKQDAQAVARLRQAGAIILGKTNVAQLLLYYESDNPVYGRTNNPWNPNRTPGGSSGGEAAIIAAGGSPWGIGTDIGGSLRIPAAFCGITSLKPTTGRLNDPGRLSIPIGQRAIISQVGPLARSVEDLALLLDVLNGLNMEPALPIPDYQTVDLSRLRVGFYTHDGILAPAPAVDRAVKEAANSLRQQGMDVFDWTPPDLPEAFHLFFALVSADGGAGFRRAWGKSKRDPRPNTITTLASLPLPVRAVARELLHLAGQPGMSSFLNHFGNTRTDQYWQLVEEHMDYQQRFAQAMERDQVDIILSPACPLPAFTHGSSNELGTAGAYTILYNVLGYPAGVVPFTRVRQNEQVGRSASKDRMENAAYHVEQNSAGLPVGVQVAARPWREHTALAVMAAIEKQALQQDDFPSTPVT